VVVVTGATGHLGTVIVRRLIERGESVRYIAREGSSAPGLDALDAERVNRSLFDTKGLADAFDGASVVYHSAARITISRGDQAELHHVNVDGTISVLAAAREANVGRVVHVGSIEAFALERGPFPITEEHGIDPDHTVMEYGRSKALSILAALDAANAGQDVVVCCPTAFIGPPDYRPSPIGRLIVDFLERRLPAYVDGGFDFVDVRDVADGVIAAGTRGPSGRIYLLSGRYVSVPDLMRILEERSGVKRPLLCLSTGLLLPLMPIVEAYYRITRRPPRFTAGSLSILTVGAQVDSSLARDELGYTTRPIEETLSDAPEWFAECGYTPSYATAETG
jgi:dihydroflavonol-4-reductase